MAELTESKKAVLKKAIIVISVAMTVFQFYTAAVKPFASMYQRPIHYAFMLLLLFLYRVMEQKNRVLRVCDYLLAILGVLGNMYIMFNYNDIQRRSTNMLAKMATLMEPPLNLPKTEYARSMINLPAPYSRRNSPSSTNIKTYVADTAMVDP